MATSLVKTDSDNISLFNKKNKDSNVLFGLIQNISKKFEIEQVIVLAKECFDFSLELFPGLILADVFFKINSNNLEHFKNLLTLFNLENNLIYFKNKFKHLKANLKQDFSQKEIFNELIKIAGIEVDSNNFIKCCDYQIKLIQRYLKNKLIDFNENFTYMNKVDEFNSHINNEATQNDFQYRHKIKKNDKEIEIILIKKNITQLNVNCILNPYNLRSTNRISDEIFNKAGKEFKNEFYSYLSNKSTQSDYAFVTQSGLLLNCEYIINFIYSLNFKTNDLNRIFRKIFDFYKIIFDSANKYRFQYLAITLLSVEYEHLIGMIALIECLTQYLSDDNLNFKNLFIVSLDESSLLEMKNFLQNGYDISFLINNSKDKSPIRHVKKILSNNELKLKQFDLKQDTNIEQTKCSICKKSSLLLSKFLDNNHFMNCSNINKKTCEICILLNQLAQISYQLLMKKNLINSKTESFCSICAAGIILKSYTNTCSSCLRETSSKNLSNVCSKDIVCNKCNGLSANILPNCYFCNFLTFIAELNEKRYLILDHDQMKCSYDFCNFSDLTIKQIIKLNCGHRACIFIQNNSSVCTVCSIKKIFQTIQDKNKFVIEKFKWEEIKPKSSILTSKLDDGEKIQIKQDEIKFEKDLMIQSNDLAFDKRQIKQKFSGVVSDTSISDNWIEMKFFVPDGLFDKNESNNLVKYHGFVSKITLPNNEEGLSIANLIENIFESGELIEIIPCKSNKNEYKAQLRIKSINDKVKYENEDDLNKLIAQLKLITN